MEHIGIDLGSRYTHFVQLAETGQVLGRGTVKTAELPGWLSQQRASHVVMEACTQSPRVCRFALSAGHAAKVVPGHLVRLLGVGARGIKTDDRDAEALAFASLRNPELPSVHLRSEQSQQRRELTAARATLVDARKRIATSVKSWLRGQLLVVATRASCKRFITQVKQRLAEQGQQVPGPIEALLATFEHLCDQLEALDEQIEQLAADDPTCQRLMSIPGVGPQVALAFTTQLDEVERFASADELASYLALVPGEATTGGKVVRTSTIKAGPGHLKALLVQAAWSMYRTRPNDPAVLWMQSIADKRGKRIAVVALARKLATVMWSMWKHGTSYDPGRACTVRAPSQATERLEALRKAIRPATAASSAPVSTR